MNISEYGSQRSTQGRKSKDVRKYLELDIGNVCYLVVLCENPQRITWFQKLHHVTANRMWQHDQIWISGMGETLQGDVQNATT